MNQDTLQNVKKWSSKSIGSGFQHWIFYTLIRLGGRGAAYLLLRCVVFYYVLFSPAVRRRCFPYLSRRFPQRQGVGRLIDCYRLSLGIGEVLVDRAALGILGTGGITVDQVDLARLEELVGQGKGLILVTSHVGAWQGAMAVLKFLATPVNLLIHRQEGDLDRHFFEHGGDSPFRIIDPAGYLGGTLEMMGALKKGEIVCIMGDRAMGSESGTIKGRFLGGEVAFPYSPYKLAAATGAPIAFIFPTKTGAASYALNLAKVLSVPHLGGRSGEPYRPFVKEYVAELERFTAEHPYQFFNFFDMWDDDGETTAKR
ncbi:LpxL/LpxP family acyltransferase [Geomonas anaerohicana]|uniref:Lysophospholipid acyltransferase family protein n=1 Tax=Geomonas anaerohicana TaxID=2798583 RepID=A0ABS0Y9S5_9BACT|nr:lysophospholipid acyltransferase family protein [Geomonas anaerohicana]MBJ6748714.1 lysophospholipid acyltransferase family protein [Geomonas anaerohicana]